MPSSSTGWPATSTVATDTEFDAKGDIVGGTGADAADRLAVGSNDTLLMADSAQTTGMKWSDASTVKTALSLNSVTNTSDASKPVSTAQQTALDLKANLISPSFTTPSLGVATSTSVSGIHIATGAATSCTGATIGAGSKNNAGFVTATTTGVSTVEVTFSFAAPTGWSIEVSNNTTANLTRQSASTTTTATFSGTTVSGDVLSYIAVPY